MLKETHHLDDHVLSFMSSFLPSESKVSGDILNEIAKISRLLAQSESFLDGSVFIPETDSLALDAEKIEVFHRCIQEIEMRAFFHNAQEYFFSLVGMYDEVRRFFVENPGFERNTRKWIQAYLEDTFSPEMFYWTVTLFLWQRLSKQCRNITLQGLLDVVNTVLHLERNNSAQKFHKKLIPHLTVLR